MSQDKQEETQLNNNPKNYASITPPNEMASTDEGAILLKHQVNDPDHPKQGGNMALPSVNADQSLKNRMSDGSSIVDMVLVYELPDPAKIDTEKEREQDEDHTKKREYFLGGLESAGLTVEIDQLGGGRTTENANESTTWPKTFFVKLHAPWDVLTKMAEEMFMRMPVKESDIDMKTTMESLIGEQAVASFRAANPLEWDQSVIKDDKMYFTAHFKVNKQEHFLGIDNKETFFSPTDRVRMVERIISQTPFSDDTEEAENNLGVSKLLHQGVFVGCYPLHDGPCEVPEGQAPKCHRQKLRTEWARFRKIAKFQPLDAIKDYFGTQIGLYFAWLGFYCTMLTPVAFLGLIVFFYGIGDSQNYPPANDACDLPKENFKMCPLCDKQCWYWYLNDSCTYMRVAHWFDNNLSIAFAVVMSIWSTLFLELWKRQQAILAYNWHTSDFEEVEEQVRPEYAAVVTTLRENPATGRVEPYTPTMTIFKKYAGVFSIVLFMITLVLFAVVGVVVYRAAVFAAAAKSSDKDVRKNAKILTSMTAAVINLIAINVLKFVYQYVAYWLTNWENPRTQTDWDDSFTVKMYVYQFVNMYSSLFYIAFFKTNLFVGTPGHYVRFFGDESFRLDSCGPQGCLVELCIQLVIIMVGQQIIGNVTEVMIPYLKKLWNEHKYKKESTDHLPQWEQDYNLAATEATMFWEYLEIVLQLGFVMMFVAAFPLAPLFAWVNGLFEIRVDAVNFIRDQRRPNPAMAEDIGAWYPILDALSYFSVLVNAFVIAFTSDFISKVVYDISYSEDGNLDGYLNNSLSYFDTSKWPNTSRPSEAFNTLNITEPKHCRYIGYRNGDLPGDPYTKQHWEVMTGRFAFVFVFQFSMSFLKRFIAWAIPDVPKNLILKKKREDLIARTVIKDPGLTASHENVTPKTYI